SSPRRAVRAGFAGRLCAKLHKVLAPPPAALAAALALFAAAATPAAASGLATLQREIGGQLALAGAGSSAYVYDLSTRQTLFSARSGVPRAPASVEKLYTAATALVRLGPAARLSTQVLGT